LKNKLIAAVTMRVTSETSYAETRSSVSDDWIAFLESAGLSYVLIPATVSDPVAYYKQFGCNLLILTNGESIQCDDGTLVCCSERDRVESELVKYMLDMEENNIILGVCRGAQLLNCFFGGEISRIDDHVAINHTVFLSSESPLLSGISSEIFVNSYHNDAIKQENLADCFEVLGITSDGCVELFAHKDRNIYGMQWHPERESPDNASVNQIINNILDFHE